jgi:serine O-acetyltransferase
MTKSKKQSDIFNYNSDQLTDNEVTFIVDRLCDPELYKIVYHRANHEDPMPDLNALRTMMDLFKSVLFPGYFLNSELTPHTMRYYIGSTIDRIFRILVDQINRGFCFSCDRHAPHCEDCEFKSRRISKEFLETIPDIRRMLSLDALAAFEGDPAAKNIWETIFCYPSILALTHHRIAHELYRLEVPLIPRIISEMAHSNTGIDIHPGATIGERFFIDHGTGTVIGETCTIGKNVRIYQGVTLGAKSFPIDDQGNPIKGIPRHPLVEDDVVIYSGATLLGRITIGKGAEIGGNVWITRDIAPGTRVVQSKADEILYENGGGI